jgi:O-antigen/teichoic acid export membrane protein
MAQAASLKTAASVWLSDSVILTGATLLAAASNYLFQAWMRRHLSWSEFGYLNTTLSLILFAGVPLTAASQTVTHHLALINAGGDPEKMARMQAASLKFLRYLTWALFALCLALIHPVSAFLRFPRASLVWMALLLVPVNLWSALGGAWCSGLSAFRLLSCLVILTAIVRLVAGGILVSFFPEAESGLAATMLSGLVLAAVVAVSPHHGTAARLRVALRNRELLSYGGAALAVSFGALAFLQGDQILAQRYFPGDELGRYSGAGLLGRAIVWVSLPVLTVYFTRRSGHDGTRPSPRHLLGIYLGMIVGGAIFLLLFRVPLLSLLLGAHDPGLDRLTSQFALAMIPIGLLQALGCHFLASRQIPESLAFGACGSAYLVALAWYGATPTLMLGVMSGAATVSIALLGLMFLVRHNFSHARAQP